jgi:outer membrane receptor protein involved in Fe transport
MWMYSYWGGSIMGSRTNWWLPSGDTHTAIVGYRWKRWDLRLRVENVFDKLSPLPSTFETAVGVTRPRNYRLGLSYTF